MKKYTLLSAFLCCATLLCAQSKLSNFARFFIEQQKEQKTTAHNDRFRKAFALKVDQNEQEYISAFVHFYDEDADKTIIERYGAVLESDFGKIITATIPVDQLEALANEATIRYVEISQPIHTKMSEARKLTNVDKVQAGTDISHPFLGTGVVVGIIDGGFQYNHVNFYDIEDSTELRVKRVMRYADNTRASGYTSKKEYTTQDAIETAQYDNKEDDSGHATHVAGIAAGSYGFKSGSGNYGVAPDADLVFVAFGSGDNDVANGIKYIFNYADTVGTTGKPAVINMSLGTHMGPHDGTSTFDQLCNSLTGNGRIIVGSAGNEGDTKLFLGKALTAGESFSDFVSFDSNYAYEDGYYNQIDIWGDAGQSYSVKLEITDKSGNILWTGDEFLFSPTSSKTTASKTFSSFGSSGAKGKIQIYAEQNSNNNKLNYTVYIGDGYTLFDPGSTKLRVIMTAKTAGGVRSWCDGYGCEWAHGFTDETVGEIGGTAWGVISVGAYTSRVHMSYSFGSKVGKIAGFSSMGPTADGRLKPDVAAPGDVLISSIPNISSVTKYADGATYETINGVKYYWGYMSGTSMSAPFVTGVIATWLQANPELNIWRIREILEATCIQDSYTGKCPNNTYGYGKIDAYAGIVRVLATVDVKQLEALDLPDAIMLYPNPNNGAFKLLFTNADSNVKVSVYAANGQQVAVKSVGEVLTQQELDIDLQGIQSGAYVVKVQGDATNTTCRLMVR